MIKEEMEFRTQSNQNNFKTTIKYFADQIITVEEEITNYI